MDFFCDLIKSLVLCLELIVFLFLIISQQTIQFNIFIFFLNLYSKCRILK